MRKRSAIAAAAAALLIGASVAGCGAAYSEDHDHNAPAPGSDTTLNWVRIDTPYGYDTLIRACDHGDGYYASRDNAPNVVVIPADPACRS